MTGIDYSVSLSISKHSPARFKPLNGWLIHTLLSL
jgi:hypothetical protein